MSVAHAPDREQQIAKTFAAAFAALDDLRSKNPDAAVRIGEVIVAHLRSSLPSVALDITIPPPIDVAPIAEIVRDLGGGAKQRMVADGGCLVIDTLDPHDGHSVIAMTPSQARQHLADAASVLAEVQRG